MKFACGASSSAQRTHQRDRLHRRSPRSRDLHNHLVESALTWARTRASQSEAEPPSPLPQLD
ncbi:hypothetical protein QP572_02135 [Brevibacterium sp. UMB10442]|nr:hypothetical protein [Brevibacterium sp. UMB10442]